MNCGEGTKVTGSERENNKVKEKKQFQGKCWMFTFLHDL